MELVNSPSRGDAHSAHKEPRTARADNINQFWQVALRVIVVRLACIATDLRQEEVNAKGRSSLLEIGLEKFDLN
jgi:hypothetical protein